jgi:hypothetical protein
MDSRIAKEIGMRFAPVTTAFTNDKPPGAMQFKEGARGCVIALVTAAAKGKVAVVDRKTCGCPGGLVGMAFTNAYASMPGGIEYFLSTGRGEGYPEGEAYKKTPELAKAFTQQLPLKDIPFTYVVLRPLGQVEPGDASQQLVSFYVNPDQLSALVVLANYGRPGSDNVIIPFGAGCLSVNLIPYLESQQPRPRAVVGLTDVTVRPLVDPDILSFTVPFGMFLEMEANVSGSFLEKKAWAKVRARIGTDEAAGGEQGR